MLFNSVLYFIFLAIVAIIYYLIPIQKLRNIFLLISSYFFYMQWNANYGYLLFFVTLITYIGSYLISSDSFRNDKKKKKLCLIISLSAVLFILFIFKYLNLFVGYTNIFLRFLNSPLLFRKPNIILPIGISFFILQSIGYLFDVYNGNIDYEKDFIVYALFVSFFPQLVAGPIERSKNLLHQFKQKIKFKYKNFQLSLYYILYGLTIKMVIADNLSKLVDNIYNKPTVYNGWYLIVATIAFSIQIYCDFYGYSIIAKGSARLLGIELMDNFLAPYYSKSIKEFWRRWHISLSTWFRDYIYIPLGGNRFGDYKTYVNLIIVFALSGLWHGNALSYLLWGLVNVLFIIIESIIEKKVNKNKNVEHKKGFINQLVTYILILFTFIIFRAGSLHNSRLVLANIFTNLNNLNTLSIDSIYKIWAIPQKMIYGTLFSIGLLFIIDYLKYKNISIINYITSKNIILRYYILILLFILIIIYGHYGDYYDPQKFIYFQF